MPLSNSNQLRLVLFRVSDTVKEEALSEELERTGILMRYLCTRARAGFAGLRGCARITCHRVDDLNMLVAVTASAKYRHVIISACMEEGAMTIQQAWEQGVRPMYDAQGNYIGE
jgi:hypothetical protein